MEQQPPEHVSITNEQVILAQERTLLAAERTFLSWIRTGLTSIGLGIAIARFIVFKNISHQHLGHRVGQLLILWGIGIFVCSLVSYKRSCKKLKQMAPTQDSFAGLTIATIVLILLSLILFWIVVE